MKVQILEGNQVWQDGQLIGPLDLTEGQRAGPFVIIESCGSLTEVKPTIAEQKMQLAEGKKTPGHLMTLEGRFQMSDTKNANNRIYPESIWKKVFETTDTDLLQSVERGEMLGEMDHPKDGETRLDRVAGRVSRLWRNENDKKEIMGRFVVFDNERGRNLKAIHEGGGRLGVSSRGQGSVVRLDGKDVVQEDFKLQTWDVVHNPSTPGAYPEEVTESVITKQTTKENDTMSLFADLQKRVSRLRKRELTSLSKDAVGLLREEAVEIQEALTTEDFNSESVKASRLVTEVTNFIRDLGDVKQVKNPAVITEITDEEEEKKSRRADTADAVVTLVTEAVQNPPTDLQEATKVARKAYRDSVSIDGPLKSHELEGVAKAAKALIEKSKNLDVKVAKIRAVVRSATLNEGMDLVIEAETERDLQTKISEALKDIEAPVTVEVDRSEAVYQECAARFSSLLEQQTLKAANVARDYATNQAAMSAISAKLAGTRQLIEGYAEKHAELKDEIAEAVADLEAATTILEAVGREFRSERLRGAVIGIAATNPNLTGLSESLSTVTSVEQAVKAAVRLQEAARPRVTREPISDAKVTEAIKKDQKARQRLTETTSKKNPEERRNVALTQRVIASLSNPRATSSQP